MIQKRIKTFFERFFSYDFLFYKYMKLTGVRPSVFILPTILYFLSACLSGFAFMVLIFLSRGLLRMDFSLYLRSDLFRSVAGHFLPSWFQSDLALLVFCLGAIYTCVFFQKVLEVVSDAMTAYQTARFSRDLRNLVFRRCLEFEKLSFDPNRRAYTRRVFIGRINFVGKGWMVFQDAMNDVLRFLVFLILLFVISWRLTGLVLLLTFFFALPLYYYSIMKSHGRIKKDSVPLVQSLQELNSRLLGMISCIPLVKFSSWEEKESRHFAELSDAMAGIQFAMAQKQILLKPAKDIFFITILIVLSFVLGLAIRHGALESMVGFFVYFYLLRRLVQSLRGLTRRWKVFDKINRHLKTIEQIFERKETGVIPAGEREFTGLKERIQFNLLDFNGPGIPPLKDVCFTIEKNQMVALVGPRNSGSVSLILLLLRFYDCKPSSILIDGSDIREFTLKSLRSKMAGVGRRMLFFSDTVRTNLTYGIDREVSEDELVDVVKKVQLYPLVMQLPDRFETFMGQGKVKLSWSEKQRFVFARAMLRKPEIFVFDEVVNSLDLESEELIQKAIAEMIRGKTTLAIARRLSTIRRADRVIVFENGRIAKEGSPEDLLDPREKIYAYGQE
ncbi:MAG: ABC transporter ATP-binding protein/permease [Candidatus Omnitrophica bacterium]|nr:ABC transporter ATP-binding protein/permease [Candidatus Omnitrophota bacterium]